MEKLLFSVLTSLIPVISPEIKKALDQFVDDLAKKAAETPNPFDDILVAFVKVLIGK